MLIACAEKTASCQHCADVPAYVFLYTVLSIIEKGHSLFAVSVIVISEGLAYFLDLIFAQFSNLDHDVPPLFG